MTLRRPTLQVLLPQHEIRSLANLSIQALRAIVEILRMPVKLIRIRLPRPLRDKVDQLLADTARPARGLHEKVVQIEVGLSRGGRRVRIVGGDPNRCAIVSKGGDRAADWILRVEEALEVCFGHVGGDCALVEDIVLLPEVDPGIFVRGLDGTDCNGWGRRRHIVGKACGRFKDAPLDNGCILMFRD